jgi:membrane-associated phospholipid phosphatase
MATAGAKFIGRIYVVLTIFLALGSPRFCFAQQPEAFPAPSTAGEEGGDSANTPARIVGIDPEKTNDNRFRRDVSRLERNLWSDQKTIWTSPSHIRPSDSQWLFPILGVTAGLIQTDGTYSMHLPQDSKTTSRYNNISNAAIGGILGGAAGMYLLSYHTHNQKWRETGLLSTEAAINSVLLVEVSKYIASRDRPIQGNGRGLFFQSGGSSFPSLHATVAWSVAGVIAHEYPGPLTKILAYSGAALVSYSRVRARQHFPSDVFVGQIAGGMIGQSVYSNHHDVELGGEAWHSLRETFSSESARMPGNQGSPYVQLDSWVYPLFDRLKAMGLTPSSSLGIRPWRRLECARLLNEATASVEAREVESPDINRILAQLQKEFAADIEILPGGENRSAQLESVYTRVTGISGSPLTDSYHFGQTLTQDFGRPFEQGINNVTGFSGWSTYGRWTVYTRGEYQFAPSGPVYSANVRNFIAGVDQNPVQPATPTSQTNQFQVLDAYVGLALSNWQLNFGQQSLSWGPSRMGAFLLSDNAIPIRMFRLNRTTPIYLPGFLKIFGPMRVDLFFGNIAGNQFPPNPFIHGEKVSFMPLPNMELGFSRTVILGGEGEPLTLRRVANSYFSTTARGPGQSVATDPGKRTGGFDATYAVPLRRLPFTFYVDSIADDNTSPLADMRRAGIDSGLYFPKLPWLSHMDLRVESAFTDVPFPEPAGNFIYWDHHYHDLYTNRGQLIGNPVGRDGKVYQAWSRYWLGPRSNIEFSYRHAQVSQKFVPGGGTINDASVHTDFWLRHSWNISATVQYERWKFPILASGPQVNITSSVGVTFSPEGGLRVH